MILHFSHPPLSGLEKPPIWKGDSHGQHQHPDQLVSEDHGYILVHFHTGEAHFGNASGSQG